MGDAATGAPLDTRDALRRSGAWLVHPVSLAALAVMVLNDHVFKHAYGAWWTGKLSDAAGLVFFPALVALALAATTPHVTPRTHARAALAITAAGFGWVKLTAAGAAAASATLSAIAGPSIVLKDPTDLAALAALPLAAWAATRPATHARAWRIAAVAPVALLASVATSPAPDQKATALAQVDGTWVLEVEDPQHGGAAAYAAWVDGEWVAWESTIEQPLEPTRVSCVPDSPEVCFQAVEGRLAVDITADGGVTWSSDWGVEDDDRAHLADDYGIPRETSLVTESVAVLPVGERWVVVAANGRDGLAVRDGSGGWERTGLAGVPDVGHFRLAGLP